MFSKSKPLSQAFIAIFAAMVPVVGNAAIWYHVNVRGPGPNCVRLKPTETPAGTLQETFGNAPRRTLYDEVNSDKSRSLVIEVTFPEGKLTFPFTTTELMCQRVHKSMKSVEADVTALNARQSSATLPIKPYTKDSIRAYAPNKSKQEILNAFGPPSSTADQSTDGIEHWYYFNEKMQVFDPSSQTTANRVAFTFSLRSGNVLRVGF